MGFTLAGEALHRLVPFSVPASVWGLVLLFLALCLGIVKVAQVKETGAFLTSVMGLLFVAPTVGIVEHWGLIQPRLLSICLILVSTTLLTFGISGGITQHLIRKEGEEDA